MSNRLTPLQYRTLNFIAKGPSGQTMLLPVYWRDRHHQTLLKRGFLRLRADPFKTKANMLRGHITARGRRAVETAAEAVKRRAREDDQRDYEAYIAEADHD